MKDKDDTLCDILASAAFDKYPSDFESKFLQYITGISLYTG